jgi:hypothetical protein
MSPKAWRISAAIVLAIMLAGLLASVIIGGCDTLIPCESGSFPMKCHWTFIATATFFAVGAVLACVQLTTMVAGSDRGAGSTQPAAPERQQASSTQPAAPASTSARRVSAIAIALLALAAAFLPSAWGIGICAGSGMALPLCGPDGMDCHLTAPVVWSCALLLVLAAAVQIAMADSNKASRPRMNSDLGA